MRAASLSKCFIDVWRWTQEQTQSGQQRKTKTTVLTGIRANRYKQSGKEKDMSNELFDSVTIIFQIRWSGDVVIKNSDIITYKGNNYKITFIEENDFERTLKITTKLMNE